MAEEEYEDYSDEELEDLLALAVLEAEAGVLEEPAPMPDINIGTGEEMLDDWQQTVDDFGGRIGSPVKAKLIEQLSQGQLGQTIFLGTSEPLGFQFPKSVLLAEVALKEAVDFDVAFEYKNLFAPEGGTAAPIYQGDGFVKLTWGVPGSFQHFAEIDGNFGWRHSFAASFLRVEYVPVDPVGIHSLKSGQGRDLGVGASITPSKGTANAELTRTFWLRDMGSPDLTVGFVPRWAKTARFVGDFVNDNSQWDLRFIAQDNGIGRNLSVVRSNADTDNWSTGGNTDRAFTIPQGVTIFVVSTLGAANMGAVNNPSLIFDLAL